MHSYSRPRSSVVLLVLAALAGACGRDQGPTAGAQAPPPTAVVLEVAEPKPIEDATAYVATLKALDSTAIQPQVDGQVTRIFVRSGDRVQRGAPLVQIDPSRQQAAVSSQEADRAAKEANVTFARQQAERAAALFKAGAISRQELEQAETAQRTAEADLQSLQAQVQQGQVQLRYYTVTAPTTGIIGDVPVRVGNLVTPSTVLTTIDANQLLEVHVSVPAERAGELRNGLAIEILDANDQKLAESKISFVSARVDDETQTLLVKGQVKNPDSRLRTAQYVRARIVWRTTQGLLIPITAVSRINGAFFAFVGEQQDGQLVARQRPIKVGPIVGGDYTVLSGIEPGDRVITSGVQKLLDGVPIAPSASTPTT